MRERDISYAFTVATFSGTHKKLVRNVTSLTVGKDSTSLKITFPPESYRSNDFCIPWVHSSYKINCDFKSRRLRMGYMKYENSFEFSVNTGQSSFPSSLILTYIKLIVHCTRLVLKRAY